VDILSSPPRSQGIRKATFARPFFLVPYRQVREEKCSGSLRRLKAYFFFRLPKPTGDGPSFHR